MKVIQVLVIGAAFFLLFLNQGLNAATVTQGTLEFEELATTVREDLKDYNERRDVIIGDIKATQNSLKKLKTDFSRSDSSAEQAEIKARTLRDTSRLLESYSQYHALTIAKVEAVLPNLEKMKKAVKKSTLAESARQLQDPEFRTGINNLYSNLSSMTMMFGDKRRKAEIAVLLKNNELLYAQGNKGQGGVENIVKNVDKMTDYLRSIYAKTANSNMILNQKKEQTKYAIELMMYALDIGKIKHTMPKFSEMMMDIPEIEVDEFLDISPLFNNDETDEEEEIAGYYDSDADGILKSFNSGANPLQ